ncbi:MAG: hypothetical protein Q7J25_10230 [Vicinamibacterales bacterium]|nr:hypothetical protein [Vicinamibacterales bacterium]
MELAEDLASIEHQLSDGKIALGMTAYQYDAWHHKTKEAQRLRKQEQPLLEKWIVDHLLHRTYELLKEMELEVVFLPGDAKLMEQLDDHHAKRTS